MIWYAAVKKESGGKVITKVLKLSEHDNVASRLKKYDTARLCRTSYHAYTIADYWQKEGLKK